MYCAGNERSQFPLSPKESAKYSSSSVDPMASVSLGTNSLAPHGGIPSTMTYTSAAHGQQATLPLNKPGKVPKS